MRATEDILCTLRTPGVCVCVYLLVRVDRRCSTICTWCSSTWSFRFVWCHRMCRASSLRLLMAGALLLWSFLFGSFPLRLVRARNFSLSPCNGLERHWMPLFDICGAYVCERDTSRWTNKKWNTNLLAKFNWRCRYTGDNECMCAFTLGLT